MVYSIKEIVVIDSCYIDIKLWCILLLKKSNLNKAVWKSAVV